MGKLIFLVLVGVLLALPAAFIAYIILSIYPNCSYLLLALISIPSIVFLIKFFDDRQMKKHNGAYEKVGTTGIMIGLIFTSLFGVYFVYLSNKVEFYIDNQTDSEKRVFVNNRKIIVPVDGYKKIKVVEGNVVLRQGDVEKTVVVKTFESKLDDHDKDRPEIFWVWNINGKGKYIKTSVTYGSNITKVFRESMGGISTENNDDDYKIITEEVFEIKAHYLFDIPEKIKSSKSFGLGSETKIVLYRYNDLKQKYDNQMEKDADWYNDDIIPEDSVVIKSSKRKSTKK
jgi:hypothetical protein